MPFKRLPNRLLVPLIVASALFLQQIDTTALSTSLPAIGEALGETPVRVHLLLTAYLFSLAAFVPVSGWIADRFGARLVFRVAIAIFTLASLVCGASDSLTSMVVARVFQGFGGALMLPVARLILVRSVEKTELISAMALMSMPALVGPIIGPLLGGFLTTYAGWRWIFLINLPIGIAGIVLVTLFIEDVRETAQRRFDTVGVLLLGLGLSSLLFGIDAASTDSASPQLAYAAIVLGVVCIGLYVLHARRHQEPVLDFALLRIPTFKASVVAGSVFRVSAGAMPFLLPLFFQTQFGFTSFHSGAITFIAAVGALGMRSLSARVLRKVGFRPALIWAGVISGAFVVSYALVRPSWPIAVILVTLFLGGVFRSLELVAINSLTFADLDTRQISQATSLSQMMIRLSQSIGVALSAFILHIATTQDGLLPPVAFDLAFALIGGVAVAGGLLFTFLRPDAGAELAGHAGPQLPKDSEPKP